MEFPLIILPAHFDLFDARRGRADPDPGDESFKEPPFAFGNGLDAAVVKIADPPLEAQLLGPFPDVTAKRNALDPAGHEQMRPRVHRKNNNTADEDRKADVWGRVYTFHFFSENIGNVDYFCKKWKVQTRSFYSVLDGRIVNASSLGYNIRGYIA